MSTPGSLTRLPAYFLFLLLTATIGPLLFGYHLAELNAPSEVITCARKSLTNPSPSTLSRVKDAFNSRFSASTPAKPTEQGLPQCIPMSSATFGLVSSSFTLGGLFGALAAAPLTARVGRVRAMLVSALLAAVGPIFEALAPNIGTMALGRFVSGLAAGSAMVVVPMYIFDIAPPGRKGFFGSFTQVMVNMGILITQTLGYFLSRGQMWRVILGIGGAIGAVQAVALLVGGQESPRWMAIQGKTATAKRVLRKIRGSDVDIEEEVASWGSHADRDLEDEEETLLAHEEHANTGLLQQDDSTTPGKPTTTSKVEPIGPLAVLTHPHTRPAVIAICMIMVAQQFTGINSIVMYGVSLLSSLLQSNSALLNIVVSALNVLITMAAAPLVEKLGRKTCLLMSISGMGTGSIMLALGIMRSIPILSALAVAVFVSSFGLGLGPVPFILPSEFVPAEAVGAVQSWALAVNWIATFCVAQFFPVLNEAMGKGQVYFVFAAMAVLFGGFVAWYVPESKGRADADEVWGRAKGVGRRD